MTTTVLADGRVLHLPGAPFIVDSVSVIMPPADDELAAIVPLVRADDLLLFTRRLVNGARRRRFNSRWRLMNRSRLELARLCIERALAEEYLSG